MGVVVPGKPLCQAIGALTQFYGFFYQISSRSLDNPTPIGDIYGKFSRFYHLISPVFSIKGTP
jgi:hypothetical protein